MFNFSLMFNQVLEKGKNIPDINEFLNAAKIFYHFSKEFQSVLLENQFSTQKDLGKLNNIGLADKCSQKMTISGPHSQHVPLCSGNKGVLCPLCTIQGRSKKEANRKKITTICREFSTDTMAPLMIQVLLLSMFNNQM